MNDQLELVSEAWETFLRSVSVPTQSRDCASILDSNQVKDEALLKAFGNSLAIRIQITPTLLGVRDHQVPERGQVCKDIQRQLGTLKTGANIP